MDGWVCDTDESFVALISHLWHCTDESSVTLMSHLWLMDHWWHLWVICDFTCHLWLHNKSWVISLIFSNILICWTDNSGYKFQPMPSFIFPDQSLAKWFTQESFQSNWGKANCGWDRQIEQVQESNKRIQFCERRSWGIENDPKRITRSPRSNV